MGLALTLSVSIKGWIDEILAAFFSRFLSNKRMLNLVLVHGPLELSQQETGIVLLD